jgi:hypothetical protein
LRMVRATCSSQFRRGFRRTPVWVQC